MHRTFQSGKPSPPAEEEDGARRASTRCGGERARGGEPEARSPRTPGEPVRGGRARVPEFRTTSGHGLRETEGDQADPLSALAGGVLGPGRAFSGQPGRAHWKRGTAGTTPEPDGSGKTGRWGPRGATARADRGVRAAPQRSPHLMGAHGLRAPPQPAKDPQQQQQSLGARGAERGRGQGLGRDGLEGIEFRGSGDRDLPRFTTPVPRRVI